MKKCSGFTLIEVAIVIAVLGIMSAFAAPRYFSLQTAARVATVKGLASSLQAGSEMTHGIALSMMSAGQTVPSITAADGTVVDILTSGDFKYYPVASSTGIIKVIADDVGDFVKDYSTANAVKFTPQEVGTSDTCYVNYVYDGSSAPVIGMNISDCGFGSGSGGTDGDGDSSGSDSGSDTGTGDSGSGDDSGTGDSGSCGSTCGDGQSCCSGACINTQTDTSNCGSCGSACSGTCSGGTCCTSGLTHCNGACINIQTDSSNCGGCGNACTSGQSCCSGACINTQTDSSNCGSCGAVCADGEDCSNGTCTPSEPVYGPCARPWNDFTGYAPQQKCTYCCSESFGGACGYLCNCVTCTPNEGCEDYGIMSGPGYPAGWKTCSTCCPPEPTGCGGKNQPPCLPTLPCYPCNCSDCTWT